MKLSKKEMEAEVVSQLAIDLNCSPRDFEREGIVFCEAKKNPDRRPFPRGERHFEMLTMGKAVIVCATKDLLPFLKTQLDGKERDEAFSMPFIHGQGIFYLPDDPPPLEFPGGFEYEFVEQKNIFPLYSLEGFGHAIVSSGKAPDEKPLRPDVLVMLAKKDGRVAAMAGASIDCKTLWQIGIDVLPEYRKLGLAAALTNRLAIEILKRGKVPYYGTGASNIPSQRTAHRAGLRPAWYCTWRGRFDGILTEPSS